MSAEQACFSFLKARYTGVECIWAAWYTEQHLHMLSSCSTVLSVLEVLMNLINQNHLCKKVGALQKVRYGICAPVTGHDVVRFCSSLQCSESGRSTNCKCCSTGLNCLTLGTMPLQPNHSVLLWAGACKVATACI